ncbi:hypothetical protein MTR_5g048950 [Medicago truncatula]|uniref:Uncharacterized protein n=1 Tax=Medicago truncatula TaxID=3880 RepID=A0A072UE57_MEDTR|nr:hypothetical protein MTR_5g048950 [Medicago truncatula]
MRLLQLKLNICNFNFLIMHVVPTRASSPQHNIKSIIILTEHQALNLKNKRSQSIKPSTYRAKAHMASSPQLQMSMHGLNNLQLRQLQQLM